MARAPSGQAVRARRVPLATAVARGNLISQSRSRGFFAAERPAAAAPHPRGEGGQGADLDADSGRRDRDGDPDPRPGQQQDELLRDGFGAHSRVHGPRDRPARLRFLLEALRAPLRRGVVRARGDPLHGCPGNQSRPHRRQLARREGLYRGRPHRTRAGPEPQPALPSMAWRRRRHFVPLVRLLRPELAAIPHTSATPWCASSSGACSRGRSESIRPPPTSRLRSSCGPTAR